VEAIHKLVEKRGLSEYELSRWLQPEDIALLGNRVQIALWYDIQSFARMNELLRDVEGGGSNEYLRKRGRASARALLEAGIYEQLEYLHRTQVASANDARSRFESFGRDLRVLTTLSGSIYNFSCWTAKPDDTRVGHYRIEVSEAASFPEIACWRSDGFLNEMADCHGHPELWRWERPTPELILFLTNRPV
jgi:hypothetical protein